MKKLLFKTIIFVFLFFIFDSLIGSFIEHYGLTHNEKTIKNIYNSRTKTDILFIGSSHTYSGIDPDIFLEKNIESVNIGLATAGPIYYKYMIRSFLENNKPPKLIVLEAAYQDFTKISDNLSYNYFIYLDPMNRISYYIENKDYKSLLLSFCRTYVNRTFFWSAIDVFLGKKEKVRWNNGFIYTEGNIVDLETRTKDANIYANHFRNASNPILKQKIEIFHNILNDLKKRGIKYVIIDLPEFYILKDPHYQEFRHAFTSTMHKIAVSHGSRFLDFNELPDCDELRRNANLFRSVDHLNWEGGRVFSGILMKHLLKNGFISEN